MELLYLLLVSLAIMFASLAGIIFISKKIKNWTQTHIKHLVALAVGVFLVVSYDLFFETFEFATNASIAWLSIIGGFIAFFILDRSYPEAHCRHDDHTCIAKKSKRGASKILISDGIHNIGDGILLAPLFMIDIRIGVIAAVSIFIHEFIQEISEFFVLKSAGYTNREALVRNFIVSSTILIGAIAGYFLASFEVLVGPLIGLATGGFIYILVVDLIPDLFRHSHRERQYLGYVVAALLGIGIILGVNALSTHQLEKEGLSGHGHLHTEEESHDAHGHDDHHHDEEDHHDHDPHHHE